MKEAILGAQLPNIYPKTRSISAWRKRVVRAETVACDTQPHFLNLKRLTETMLHAASVGGVTTYLLVSHRTVYRWRVKRCFQTRSLPLVRQRERRAFPIYFLSVDLFCSCHKFITPISHSVTQYIGSYKETMNRNRNHKAKLFRRAG